MKTLNKRAKIVLAIVGIVAVIAVIGLVITQPPASELFGATAAAITPSNPTIAIGASTGLSVVNWYGPACSWTSSNPAVVSFTSPVINQPTVTVKGNAAGSATIKASCGFFSSFTTTVTVAGSPTPSPLNPATVTLHKNQGYQEYHVDGAKSCSEWTSDPTRVIVIEHPSTCGTTCVWTVPFAVGSTKLKTRCFMEITQNYVNYEATINVVSP